MEKRISIVRGCLLVFGLGLALCTFGNLWTVSGRAGMGGRLWMGILDGVLALTSITIGLGWALSHRPHTTIAVTVGMSSVLTVIGALNFTVFAWPFFGVCNFAAAAAYVGLTLALARDLPTGGTLSVQRAAEEALARHVEASPKHPIAA